jgi:hypothetical protein
MRWDEMKGTEKAAPLRLVLRLLGETTSILRQDLTRDVKDLESDILAASAGKPPVEQFNLHLKSSIRSLFGLAEAFSNSLTAAVVEQLSLETLDVSNADRAVLFELQYDAAGDVCLSEARRYPLLDRLEVASRLFLAVCGATALPAWEEEVKAHFKELTRARNRFTHPRRIEDLYPSPVFESLRQISVWLPAQVVRILAHAAVCLGVPHRPLPPETRIPTLIIGQAVRPEDIFDDDFYKHIFSNPGSAIQYIGLFSKHIDDELQYSLALCSAALRGRVTRDKVGRAVRSAVRTLSTNAEGTIGFTSFFMKAVRRSGGKVAVPQPQKGEGVPARLIRTLEGFSSAFGNDIVPARNGGWPFFCDMFSLRDRLTHPRRANDVDLRVRHLEVVIAALDWYLKEVQPAIFLNQEKIADSFGAQRSSHNKAMQRTPGLAPTRR